MPIYSVELFPSGTTIEMGTTETSKTLEKLFSVAFPAGTTISSINYYIHIEKLKQFTVTYQKDYASCEDADGYCEINMKVKGSKEFVPIPSSYAHCDKEYAGSDTALSTFTDGKINTTWITIWKVLKNWSGWRVTFKSWVEITADKAPETTKVYVETTETSGGSYPEAEFLSKYWWAIAIGVVALIIIVILILRRGG